MDTAEIEVFLVLAEELHFGRTAERLHVPQPRVSRLVAALEHRAGGALFERTSRRVRLTPLGQQLASQLRPAYAQLIAALDDARATATEASGVIRVGFSPTSSTEMLTRLTEAFEARNPGCRAVLAAVSNLDPYTALRHGELDVLVNWLAVDEPDLTVGPVLEERDRVLAVASGDQLAARPSVSVEDLADREVALMTPPFPPALYDAIIPPRTPSGRPIRRSQPVHGIHELVALVARGQIVHPTASGIPMLARDDIVLVPIRDLPPLPLGLIWCTAHENARIQALAETARSLRQRASPGTAPGPGSPPPTPVRSRDSLPTPIDSRTVRIDANLAVDQLGGWGKAGPWGSTPGRTARGSMILVIGGGSRTGRELVRLLRGAGAQLRILTRAAEPADGPDSVVGDLGEPGTLDRAMAGVDKVFLLCSAAPSELTWHQNAIDAAARAGADLLVRSSILGANAHSPSRFLRDHGQADEHLRASGVPYTILRPNFYMHNVTALWPATLDPQGNYYAPAGDARISMVDARDVAAVAARAITGGGHSGKAYDVTGPEALSHAEACRKLGTQLGRSVRYVPVEDAVARSAMLSAGVGEWLADGLIELYRDYRRSGTDGYAAQVHSTVLDLTGAKPRTLDGALAV